TTDRMASASSTPSEVTALTDRDVRSPQDGEALTQDLSSPAILIHESIVLPTYTEKALDAHLEASLAVEVYVDSEGHVRDVRLPRKVGYGMDRRILRAARNARFMPKKNREGASEEGWASIKFNLRIP